MIALGKYNPLFSGIMFDLILPDRDERQRFCYLFQPVRNPLVLDSSYLQLVR